MFNLDLDTGLYTNHTTVQGMFDGHPDQLQRIELLDFRQMNESFVGYANAGKTFRVGKVEVRDGPQIGKVLEPVVTNWSEPQVK